MQTQVDENLGILALHRRLIDIGEQNFTARAHRRRTLCRHDSLRDLACPFVIVYEHDDRIRAYVDVCTFLNDMLILLDCGRKIAAVVVLGGETMKRLRKLKTRLIAVRVARDDVFPPLNTFPVRHVRAFTIALRLVEFALHRVWSNAEYYIGRNAENGR